MSAALLNAHNMPIYSTSVDMYRDLAHAPGPFHWHATSPDRAGEQLVSDATHDFSSFELSVRS